jgi:hypothetical protein
MLVSRLASLKSRISNQDAGLIDTGSPTTADSLVQAWSRSLRFLSLKTMQHDDLLLGFKN